jgi:hypothetical protein
MSQLDAFERALPPDPDAAGPIGTWMDRDTKNLLGRDLPLFTAFMRERVRSSVGDGVLRFLLPDTRPSLLGWNGAEGWHADWPSMTPGVVFASDWMGDLFMVSSRMKRPDGQPSVAMLVPATAEVVDLEVDFGEFLGVSMAFSWQELLMASRLSEWQAAGRPTPRTEECVVPKVSPLIGGSDAIVDCEVISLLVAVSLAGQIWEQVKDLPPGTKISGFRMA